VQFRRYAHDSKVRAAVLAMTGVLALGSVPAFAGAPFAASQAGIRNLDVIQDIGAGLRDDQGDEIAPPVDPTATAEPTDTPDPAATPEPTDTPEPAATAEPTDNQGGDQGDQGQQGQQGDQGDHAGPTHAPEATDAPEQTQNPDGGNGGGQGGDSNGGSQGG
jgi:hypothetical protein